MTGLYIDKEYQKKLEKAWELFNSGEEINEPRLSQAILDSWDRSRKFNVRAEQVRAPEITAKQVFEKELEQYSKLQAAASPVIQDARTILDDYGLFMLLTSPKGTIIKREGSVSSLSTADSKDLIIGSNWSEKHCGTNAVGTAISLKRPIQIIAQEHYCEMVHGWGCAAVPVKDLRDGRILAILDTTGDKHEFDSMIFGWVNSMASCIEFRLNEERTEVKYQIIDQSMEKIRRWQKENVLLFDEDGFLIWKSESSFLENDAIPDFLQNISLGTRVDKMAVAQEPLKKLSLLLNQESLEPVILDGKLVGHILILHSASKKVTDSSVKNLKQNTRSSLLKGVSSSTNQLRELAKRFASVNATVTIIGETGTGKEVMAREIHSLANKTGEFVAVNCGAMQQDLLASELFGYKEGSFTGARRGGMIGKFEAANNGTLLLDEFCELPYELQCYLLRVLEDHEVVPVGDSIPRPVNARIIVATNKNLEEEVESGRLREDLYYRVNANVIQLPPLRERKDDIPILFEYFMGKVASECGGREVPKLTEEFIHALNDHSWPGNTRELRNFAENCFLMNDGEELKIEHIPKRMQGNTCAQTLKELEQDTITKALELHGGNVTEAAKYLGIARSTFYQKIKKN